MRSGWAVEVQHASDEIADGDAQVAPEAALQAGIVLSAAEEIAHQLPENRAASDELHHARGYGGSEKRAAIETADDARGKFQLGTAETTRMVQFIRRSPVFRQLM